MNLASGQVNLASGQGQPLPWRDIGYRQFTKFISSDNDFLIFRRFDTLAARVLLSLQDRLTRLEEELDSLEKVLSRKSDDIHNGTFRQDKSELRTALINKIHDALKEYQTLLIQHSDLRSRPAAAERNIQSLRNWFEIYKGAIIQDETRYIDEEHVDDLVPLVPEAKTPLHQFLDRYTGIANFRLWRKPPPPSLENVAGMEVTSFYDENIVDRTVSISITFVGLAMLIAPIWILPFVTDAKIKLGIITIFTVIFVALMNALTVAQPFENLASAAGYAAVLTIFLQFSPSAV